MYVFRQDLRNMDLDKNTHMYLSELAFINQFYSRMTSLFQHKENERITIHG